MRDDIKEQISAFIDNESHDSDLIASIKNDEEMRGTMARYSLVGDVLNNRYTAGSHTLVSRISDSLGRVTCSSVISILTILFVRIEWSAFLEICRYETRSNNKIKTQDIFFIRQCLSKITNILR